MLRMKASCFVFASRQQPFHFTPLSSSPTKVHSNTKRFREGMKAAGFTVAGDPDHPICPIMLGDARLASEFADEMLKRDIFVIGFSFPVSVVSEKV